MLSKKQLIVSGSLMSYGEHDILKNKKTESDVAAAPAIPPPLKVYLSHAPLHVWYHCKLLYNDMIYQDSLT